ncbi:repressor LexA [Anaerospora hongkongensis]|uniref:Repressor LexA n=1 Tax=Anaerospora hongkongensis TaxID=244830 RepID=A0A4V2Q8B5_9FIRM|nr:S24 family peptidase [Anaerospora hongkongensis]TCL35617.1 repressor LexA [Anaerospora hongkongensis]
MSGLGNKEIMSKNLKFYMDKYGKDRNDICTDLNFKYSTFTDWVNGNKYPRIDKIEMLANYFGIQKSDLIEERQPNNRLIDGEDSQTINLPIVGRVSCGNGSLAYEDIEGYEPTPKSWLNGGEYFYSRVIGDSMINARIQHGDLALIRRQPEVENGEIAAVTIGDMNDDRVYLKRVYKKNGTIVLQSENPAFPPIIYDPKHGDCRIVGKLKRIVITI